MNIVVTKKKTFEVLTILDIIRVITGCIRYMPKEYLPIKFKYLDNTLRLSYILIESINANNEANMTYK